MSSALDDIEFAMELIEVFRLTTGPTLAQFEDAVTAENWQAAALHSHTVKGSARTLGLEYLGQTCGRLESWARANADGDLQPRPASPGLLKASHQTALDALDRFAHSQ